MSDHIPPTEAELDWLQSYAAIYVIPVLDRACTEIRELRDEYERIAELERELAAEKEAHLNWKFVCHQVQKERDAIRKECDALVAALELDGCQGCMDEARAILAVHDRALVRPLVEALEKLPCLCKPMGFIESCPQCGNGLRVVRNPRGSMLNDEQFDSVRAGDYFCDNCKGSEAKSGYKYWWKKDLEQQRKQPCIRCAALAPYRCPTCDGSETVFDDPSAPCPTCAGKEVKRAV